jgi:DNA-binding transcriptional ArsR family regulator
MSDKPKARTPTANVIRLRPAAASQASDRKWGKAVMTLGFSMLPSLLFRAQARLGLNPTQLALLVQLADYWWAHDRKPYPTVNTLAERLGLGPRQVRRHIEQLEKAGLVKRVERRATHAGRLSNEYDLSGLVEKLKNLEPEFRQVKELNKQVTRRGGLPKQEGNRH